jgi:peptidoglycan/xylan/chitin deacetylase (PgdA/CDA1 family)
MIFLPILCYHQVSDAAEAERNPRFRVRADLFAAHMGYLKKSGYRCLSLREAFAALRTSGANRRKTVVLTFDDGYQDFYDRAYPVLRQYGFSATIFPVVDSIGKNSGWDHCLGNPLMGWETIDDLHRCGIEFGSHSMTHPFLTKIPVEAARQELVRSKQVLEDRLGTRVCSFAYPYGDKNPATERLVEEAGYSYACSTVHGNVHDWRELLRLKRVFMSGSTSMPRFRRRLSRLYEVRCRLHNLRRKFGRRRDSDDSAIARDHGA